MTSDPTDQDRRAGTAEIDPAGPGAIKAETERAKSAATRDVEAALTAALARSTTRPSPKRTRRTDPDDPADQKGRKPVAPATDQGPTTPAAQKSPKPKPTRDPSTGRWMRSTPATEPVAEAPAADSPGDVVASHGAVAEAPAADLPADVVAPTSAAESAADAVSPDDAVEATPPVMRLRLAGGWMPGQRTATPAQRVVRLEELAARRSADRAEGPTDDLGARAAEVRATAATEGKTEAAAAEKAPEKGTAGEKVPEGNTAGGKVTAEEAAGEKEAAGRGGLLAGVLVGEPEVGDGVAAVYRRAEKMRRRRVRRVVAAGVVSAAVVAAFGYALATAVIPAPYQLSREAAPVVGPAPAVDSVLVALEPVLRENGLRAVRREPSAGPGWRQYAVAHATSGRPRGLIEVAAYAAPDGLCFPVLKDREACARPMGGGDVEYARYTDEKDVDWQVQEVIARRLSDGRVVAVMATGERGTGKRADGRAPLTAAQVARIAVDVRVMSAFGPEEKCTGPDAACPVLKIPVPIAD